MRALTAKPQTHEKEKGFQVYAGYGEDFIASDSCVISIAFFGRGELVPMIHRLEFVIPIPGNGVLRVFHIRFTSCLLCGTGALRVGIMWAPQGSENMDGWPIVAVYLKEMGVRVIVTNLLLTE